MKMTKCFLIASLFVSTTLISQTLEDAIKQTTNEQFTKADASFNALLAAQPSNGDLYFYYGENHFKSGNMEMANKVYQKGADVNATNPMPYVGLGKVQWYQGKQSEAKANFYKATTLAAGKNATVLIKIAEVYIKAENKDFAEANKLLDQAQKLEPKNPEILLLKGDAVLEQNNDGSKAIAYYEEAAKLNPKSVSANLRIGQLWNRSKNYTAALDSYKKAISIDSLFAPAHGEMAEIYLRAGQFNNAVAKFKRYLELTNDCASRSRYAGALVEAKHFAEAIEAGNEALKCDSNNVYLYRYLAFSQYEQDDYINGLINSQKFFLKANPDTKIIAPDYEYRAKLYAKNTKDSLSLILAVADFKKALELQPDKIELYGDIAGIYTKMQKYEDAIEAYKIKIAAGKANANDYFGMGRAYYLLKDFVNADSAFAQVIAAQPDLPIGYAWRAKANSQQDPKNEKWQAKPYFEQLIEKVKPEDVDKNKNYLIEAYNYLSAFYADKKDCPTLKLYMQKVLELDAANAQAKKVLAGLKC